MRAYLAGLVGTATRKNGWQYAEDAGEARPNRMQRQRGKYNPSESYHTAQSNSFVTPLLTREWVEQQMVDYMQRQQTEKGTPWPSIARHMLGLRHGLHGARRWRQTWSDHKLKHLPPHEVMRIAHDTPAR